MKSDHLEDEEQNGRATLTWLMEERFVKTGSTSKWNELAEDHVQ